MRYSIAIVEDHFEGIQLITDYLHRFEKEHDVQFDIVPFRDGDEITSDYEAKYDIILMDIEMNRLNGMDAARKIRALDKEVIIIFVTHSSHYAIKGYEVEALSYLLKPVPYFAFQQEITKSIDRISKRTVKSLLLKTDKGTKRVNINDIIYIETMSHYLIIHTKSGEYTIKSTLKRMEDELKDSQFFLCNSCYLVNLNEVTGVKGEFVMIHQEELKISRPRKKVFMDELTKHFGGKI